MLQGKAWAIAQIAIKDNPPGEQELGNHFQFEMPPFSCRANHKQLCLAVREILSADQVVAFKRLRGEKPQSTTKTSTLWPSAIRGTVDAEKPAPTSQESAVEIQAKLTILNQQKKLNKRISLQFRNAILKDVLVRVGRLGNLNLGIDRAAFDELGVSTKERISVDLDEIEFGLALSVILDPLGLTYVVQRDVIKITKKQKPKANDGPPEGNPTEPAGLKTEKPAASKLSPPVPPHSPRKNVQVLKRP